MSHSIDRFRLTIFVAIMIGWPLPLAPLQILWLNIITDVFPAILCVALQLAAVYVSSLKLVLHTVPLLPQDWVLVLAIALLPVAAVEVVKLGKRLTARKQVS